MKGVELPINMLIIVVLAVIVFIAAVAFFMNVWGPSTGGVNVEAAKNNACNKWVARGCEGSPSSIGVSDVEGISNLEQICDAKEYYGCEEAAWTDDNDDDIIDSSEVDSDEKLNCCKDVCNC